MTLGAVWDSWGVAVSSDPAVIVHLSALGSCNFELLWLCRQHQVGIVLLKSSVVWS